MCKVGLVLSGGMAKGAYQVGALKAVNEYLNIQDIDYISSSSIGVLNAYAFISGKLSLAEELWKDVCCDENRRLITTVCRGAFLQQSIKKLINESDTISTYFYTTLYNIKKNALTYLNLSSIDSKKRLPYLKASIAMPFYSKAVNIDNNMFLDGAMIDNIPIYPLKNHDIDYIICIYFDECNYLFENEQMNSKIIKLIFSDKAMIKNSVCVDEQKINYMIESGYRYTKEILETIMVKGADDLEYIYRKIELYNKFNSNIKLRVTGDMIVSNCNRVAKKLVKRQIIV